MRLHMLFGALTMEVRLKLRNRAAALFSGLVARHFGRLITAIFVCIAVIGGTGCKAHKSTEGSAVIVWVARMDRRQADTESELR